MSVGICVKLLLLMQINYHKIILELEKILDGEVVYDRKTLEQHAIDASLFKVIPQIVIYPKNKFDISKVVKYVNKLKSEDEQKYQGLSITARAAGTCMSGGSLNNSIILDVTKYLNKVEKLNTDYVVCEPGVYYRDLEKQMEKYNVFLPSYPASKDLCCIGGIVSNNSAGEKTLVYGQTKDWLEEVEMILADGSMYNFKKLSFAELDNLVGSSVGNPFVKVIYRNIKKLIEENREHISAQAPKVSKNSSGYNLWETIDFESKSINLCKLICGSQGTFGIITKVKLSLARRNKYTQMLTIFLPSLEKLVPVVQEVLKYRPESLESYDDHTFKIAMKFLPTIIWKLKGSIWTLLWSFIPEAWLVLTGGVPKIILLAEFTGDSQREANKKALNAYNNTKKFGLKTRLTKNQTDINKYWLFRRESFNLLRSKLKGLRTAPFVEDVIVPIEAMAEFLPRMQKVLDDNNLTYTIAGHAGNGNFHIIPLMKLNSFKEVEDIKRCNDKIFSLVSLYKGSISAEHNDGLVRTPYLHYMFDKPMLELFSKTKSIFDPLSMFNPGKKVGGSVEGNYRMVNIVVEN